MPNNINTAFRQFLADTVNLDADETILARTDRDNLKERLANIATTVATFPKLLPDRHIHFGSFSRKTKRRPLDDVDMMFCLNAEGATYNEYAGNTGIEVYINQQDSNLWPLTNNDTNTLNSIKVLNKFKTELSSLYHYRSAELNTRQEAVKLKLTTRAWSFDIVPCFHSDIDQYLIPDGGGKWKKTDPRVDKARMTGINTSLGGNVLNPVRIIKFWNSRATMPTMPSYLLEVMIINHYQTRFFATQYVDMEIPPILEYIRDNIFNVVWDPKGFQGDLNTLTWEQRNAIFTRANLDLSRSLEARGLEASDMPGCMRLWKELFGPLFPGYET